LLLADSVTAASQRLDTIASYSESVHLPDDVAAEKKIT